MSIFLRRYVPDEPGSFPNFVSHKYSTNVDSTDMLPLHSSKLYLQVSHFLKKTFEHLLPTLLSTLSLYSIYCLQILFEQLWLKMLLLWFCFIMIICFLKTPKFYLYLVVLVALNFCNIEFTQFYLDSLLPCIIRKKTPTLDIRKKGQALTFMTTKYGVTDFSKTLLLF